jgi:hypothetical protein
MEGQYGHLEGQYGHFRGQNGHFRDLLHYFFNFGTEIAVLTNITAQKTSNIAFVKIRVVNRDRGTETPLAMLAGFFLIKY